MGKILEYNDFNAAPADADLLFFADASNTAANPATYRLKISDLNKKRNVDAATSAGLLLRDDSSTFGIQIHDGGNVGVGPGAATTPGAFLSVRGAADSNLTLANFLNPSATTDGKYQQIIFGTDAATDKSVIFRYYYSTTDDASTLRIQHYEDAALENEIGLHLKGDGNVGIGETDPQHPLDVKGTVVSNGSFPLILDPSTGELKSNGATTLNFNKSANANISFMYLDSDGSTVNPALSIKSSNKRVSIGNDSSPDSKLHIKEADQDTNPVVKIENTTSSGHTAIELTRNGADEFITWDGSTLAIAGTNIAASSATANFQTGKIGLGTTTFTRKLNVTDSNNIGAQFVSSSTAGSRIILETGPSDAAATYSSLVGFPLYISSVKKVGWMSGALRLSDVNYFGIHYSDTTFGVDSTMAFNGTLALNLFYIDTSGNVTIKGNAAADAFYDKGGTTVGNYCRGRFVQTFSVPYYADVNNRFSPLLAPPFDRTDDTAGSTITAKWVSIAPHDGRIQSVRAAAKNNASAQTNMTIYVYTGSSLPAGTELATTDSAYMQGYDGGGATANTQLQVASLANAKITLGYSDFGGGSAGGQSNLDFSQGDYLMFSFDCDSGNANLNVDFTCEFYIDDTL
jgi:hypothetical protein